MIMQDKRLWEFKEIPDYIHDSNDVIIWYFYGTADEAYNIYDNLIKNNNSPLTTYDLKEV